MHGAGEGCRCENGEMSGLVMSVVREKKNAWYRVCVMLNYILI